MGYKISKGYMWVREPNIPAEYQEVEWIESSGTSCGIDTGITPSNTSFFEIEFKMNPTTLKSSGNYFYGCKYTSNDWLSFEYTSSNGSYWNVGSSTLIGTLSPNLSTGTDYIFDCKYNGNNGGTLTVSGTYSKSVSYSGKNGSSSLYFFCAGNDLGSQSAEKLYYLKIYTGASEANKTLVRDLVPCYRKSDNIIGMYDRVEGQFYTNAGTGVFTKGNDVTPTYVFKEKQFYPGGGEPSIDWILFDETDYKNSVPSKNSKFHYAGWGSTSYWTNIGYDTTNGRIYSTSSHSLGATNINANSELVNAKKIKFICDYLYCYNYNTYLSGTTFPPFTMQMNYNFSASLWDQTTSDPAIGSVVAQSTPYSAEFYYDLDLDSGTLLIKNLNTQAETELAIAGFKYTWDTYLPGGNFGFSIWMDQGYSSYMGDVHLYYSLT